MIYITNKNQDVNNNLNKNLSLKSCLKTFLLAFILSFLISKFIICPTLVSGLSMYPTLKDNQYLVVSRISNYTRGDIITFKNKNENNKILIKRIIGIEGDKIEIKDGYIYRNGDKLDEPYINSPTDGDETITVEDNKLFVLGDNRRNSLDSRYKMVGQVDKSAVIGKAIFSIYPFEISVK